MKQGEVVALSGDPDVTCYGRPHLHLVVRDYPGRAWKYNPVNLIEADWDNLALVGSFRAGFQRDLDNPRKWQQLDDQPPSVTGGPIINNRPAADQPVGIWGVSVVEPLAALQFVTARLEESTASPRFLIETTANTTVVERRSDGQRWTVPAGGRPVFISPDEARVAWTVSNVEAPYTQQVAAMWLAKLDGTEAQQVGSLPRGGLNGWIDEDTLLISGRDSQTARDQYLAAYDLASGERTELARAERLRGQTLSPSGAWLAYYITFDPDPARNGLWIVSTDGRQSIQLDDTLFGSYQWRPCAGRCSSEDDRLVIIPLQPNAPLHWLVELNPASGDARQLTDPAVIPIKIANGDWRISPNGRYAAYVESSDRNIWLLELPER